MRPLRLLIDGFGSYRTATDIDFTDVEFFALVGPTGSGKSTVIDALCFALYGTVPRWDNEREVRNALAPSANACTVSLIFELAGQRYVAVRSLQRGARGQVSTKAARLERLDPGVPADAPLADILAASVEAMAEGPDEVRGQVQDLLGLSYQHFTQSVLLPQGGFAEFLRATPANRQKLLVELLAFGVYKEIGQQARARADQAAGQQQLAQQQLGQLTEATEETETAAAGRVADLTALADAVDQALAALSTQHEQTQAAAAALSGERDAAGRLAAVGIPAGVPGLAGQIAAAQDLVDGSKKRRDETAAAAVAADDALAALPDKATTQQQLQLHALRRELTADAERQAAALAASEEAEAKLTAQLEAADIAAAAAQDALDTAQRAHAAAGLAEELHAGDRCPVCQQNVAAVPPHPAPADLAVARAAVQSAGQDQRRARAVQQDAAKATAAAQSALDATRGRLTKAADVMATVPAEAELSRTLAALTTAEAAVAAARTAAAASQRELTSAEQARAALGAAEQQAWAALGAARDQLVSLGAPAIAAGAGQDLAAAWASLAEWAAAEHALRAGRLAGLAAAAEASQRVFDEAATALAALLTAHEVTAEPLTRAPAVIAGLVASTEARLQRIRADRKQAARLGRQIATLKADSQVADLLGQLLRANKFENWLCSEALSTLVREASATLMELSGDQYELSLDSRNDLVVIDYNDAGSMRPVHTLSGGETFQASLALALALSRQVIGLSGGRRELNSMFLDEGFGTLDSDTLETVASTLERLAADSDRMVGVITHVPELAERVPVRFAVSRSGASSVIVREQA